MLALICISLLDLEPALHIFLFLNNYCDIIAIRHKQIIRDLLLIYHNLMNDCNEKLEALMKTDI